MSNAASLLGLDVPKKEEVATFEAYVPAFDPGRIRGRPSSFISIETSGTSDADALLPGSWPSRVFTSGGSSAAMSQAELVEAKRKHDEWYCEWPPLTDDPIEHVWPPNEINPILTNCSIRLDWDVLEDPSHADLRPGLPSNCFRDQRYSPALTPLVKQIYIVINVFDIVNVLPPYPIITVTAAKDAVTCWDVLLAIQSYVATEVTQDVFDSFTEARQKAVQMNFKYNRSAARHLTTRTLGQKLQIGDLLGDQTKFKSLSEDQALVERILAETAPGTHAAGFGLTIGGFVKTLVLDLQMRENLKSPFSAHPNLDNGSTVFADVANVEFKITDRQPSPFKPIAMLDQEYTLEQLMKLRPAVDLTGLVTISLAGSRGHGGFATVLSGEYIGETVAIKVLRFSKSRNSKPYIYERPLERRTLREINVWAALSHPHILPFYGFTTDHGDFPSMVSPWCEHGNAFDYLRRDEGVSFEERFRLTQQVASGIQYLHDLKIVHGDIKPRNVLIDSQHNALVADFGLVRLDEWQGARGMTTTSIFTGSERYIAPELVVTRSNPNPKATKESDIWALGCVTMEFVENIEPYRDVPNHLLKETILDGEKPAAQGEGENVLADTDSPFWDLLRSCWEHEPKERPRILDIRHQLHAIAENLGFNWKDEVMRGMLAS